MEHNFIKFNLAKRGSRMVKREEIGIIMLLGDGGYSLHNHV